jgi:hypothetical protein
MAPTGSFINEQSVTIPNLLYNLIASVLTEDQSARPISNLKVEMSVATNRRVVSFAYTMSLVVRWKTPKRVGLIVLFKSRTGSAELVKVRKTLCRVGDMFAIPNGFLLDVENFLCAVYPSIS